MKTVLLKTRVRNFVRYRLFAISENSLEHLFSEENLAQMSREILKLDFPWVIINFDELKEKEQKLITTSPKIITELSQGEKYRFCKYYRTKTKVL